MFAHRTRAVLALLFVCLFALPAVAAEPAATLPRLVDLGAGKCIPCKKMAPILEEMKKDYAGVVDVVFVDVWKDPKAGKPYKIRVIPTQIFYDKAGKEVFRHEGFFSREEIEKVFLEKMSVKPIAGSQKKEEKGTSESLLPGSWDADTGETDGQAFVPVGQTPEAPPLRVHIVYASVACACVMERCQRQGRMLHELMDPRGLAIVQDWTDRMDDPERADSLMAAYGLGYLPAIAFVDASGRPYYGDDEELDFDTLKTWIAESL
jgi:thioredoxin 1